MSEQLHTRTLIPRGKCEENMEGFIWQEFDMRALGSRCVPMMDILRQKKIDNELISIKFCFTHMESVANIELIKVFCKINSY